MKRKCRWSIRPPEMPMSVEIEAAIPEIYRY
jgi:hypothetical protein